MFHDPSMIYKHHKSLDRIFKVGKMKSKFFFLLLSHTYLLTSLQIIVRHLIWHTNLDCQLIVKFFKCCFILFVTFPPQSVVDPTKPIVIKIVICNQQMKVCLALGKLKMSRLTHFTFYHDFKIVKLSPVGRQIFKVTILLCTKWPFYLETKKSIRFTISQRIGILAIEEKMWHSVENP